MNTPNPLVPQGTLPVKGKSTVFFKVLMILSIHVVVIGGMLLQGCKDTKDTSSNQPDTTSSTASTTDTLPPVATQATLSNTAPATLPTAPTAPGVATTSAPPPAIPTALPTPPVATQPVLPAQTVPGGDYVTIASGDTLGAIAHKNGISLKALLEANPGINPRKLQPGQKVQLPAGGAVASTGTPGTGGPDAAAAGGDTSVYVVKSGDTLSKIAKANHTTYKKIMALNDLKTTSIKAGQKLKMPAPKETPATTIAPPTTTAATSSTTASN